MNPELFKELSKYAKDLILGLDFDRLDKMRYVFNFTDEDFKKLILDTYANTNQEGVSSKEQQNLTKEKVSSKEQKQKSTNPKPVYLLSRQVLGANLVNTENKKDKIYLREYFFFQNDFEDGDLVTLEYDSDNSPVLTKVGKGESTTANRLGVFPKGIVKKSILDGTYYVEDNINGELLGEYNSTERRYVIGDSLPILGSVAPKEGDTVDLAWELGKPATILQRQWYFSEDVPEKETPKAPKKKKSTQKEKEEESTSVSLDYDLEGKKIGLVLGDGMRSGLMSFLVVEHGGVPVTLDAHRYQGDESAYKHKLKDCDAVVVAKDYVRHAVTKALRNVTKELGIGYAMANGVGFAQVEKAIYRAINGLQVDEVGANIDYPLLSSK
jgi:hypothetical protein